MDTKPQTLPKVEKIVTETIDGKQVQKQMYADGSYGIRNNEIVTRYFDDGKAQTYLLKDNKFILKFENLSDGTKREFYDNGKVRHEQFPDGTKRDWHINGNNLHLKVYEHLSDGTERSWYLLNGYKAVEKFPDGTETRYDEKSGKITYHATKGVEDTAKYIALHKVAERQVAKSEKMRQDAEAKGKTPEKTVVKKLSPLQKSIQMAKALKEAKKSLEN